MIGLQNATIEALYTLEETIAKEVFTGLTYPWEALPKIKDFIISLGDAPGGKVREKRRQYMDCKVGEGVSKCLYRRPCHH